MSLFKPTPRATQQTAPVHKQSRVAERGERTLRKKQEEPAPIESTRRPDGQLEVGKPREPIIARDPNGRWLYDARGLFFRVVSAETERGYEYECWRFGPRNIQSLLTSEERRKLDRARENERRKQKKAEARKAATMANKMERNQYG